MAEKSTSSETGTEKRSSRSYVEAASGVPTPRSKAIWSVIGGIRDTNDIPYMQFKLAVLSCLSLGWDLLTVYEEHVSWSTITRFLDTIGCCSRGLMILTSTILLPGTHALPVVAKESPSRVAEAIEQELVGFLKAAIKAIPFVGLYGGYYLAMQRMPTEDHLKEYRIASLIGSLLPSIFPDARSSVPLQLLVTGVSSHLIFRYAQAWSPGFYRNPLRLGILFVGAFLLDLMFCHLSAPSQGVATALFWQLLALTCWCVLLTLDIVSAYRVPLRTTLQRLIELLS